MKKTRTVQTLVGAAVVAFAGLGVVGIANAEPGNGNGAIIDRVADNTCSLGALGGLAPCRFQRVETPSGNITYEVKGQLDPAATAPDQATPINSDTTGGLICAPDAPNFQNGVLTPSGQWSARCSN